MSAIEEALARVLRRFGLEWPSSLPTNVGLWRPTLDAPSFLAPVVALSGLLALALLAGVTLVSLGSILGSLLAAFLILERIFGVNFDLA